LPQPSLLIVAGPNGAGKTTLTRWLRSKGIELGEYINPDDIANEVVGTYEVRVSKAQAIADQRREACILAGRSFCFETVMSHVSKIDILIQAKAAGFFIQLFFVGTDDPQTNIERVALRVAQGGHDVPVEKISARWLRTMEMLHQAIAISDEAFVFDNSALMPAVSPPLVFYRKVSATSPDEPPDDRKGPDRKPDLVRILRPVPAWVQQYILTPLKLKA
jgi:predicted ABC-type ATPase